MTSVVTQHATSSAWHSSLYQQPERHLLTNKYSCATSQGDSQIWHQSGFVQCYDVVRHVTHYCTIYDNITNEFSNQAL